MEINETNNDKHITEKSHIQEIEIIFKDDINITEIYENSNPIGVVYDIIESHFRRTKRNIEYDSNVLTAISEFHVNNLIFLKESFNFPEKIYCKLLNLLGILLNLRDENDAALNYSKRKSVNTSEAEEDSKEDFEEPDFAEICKKKLSEIKNAFYFLNLVPKKISGGEKKEENNFYLKNSEIASLLDYVKTFYIPFIRLFYHFINIEKITETKKIDVIINRPLQVPALSLAVLQAQEKHHFEEQKVEKVENSENKKLVEKKEEVKNDDENKKEDVVETYQDVMNRLNINNETRKIIAEKIEELHSEVNHKIAEREKKLEAKLKDIEDQIKGRKK